MAPGGPIRGASSCRTQHGFKASTLERCRVLVVSHGTLATPSAAAAVPRQPARAAFSSPPNDSGSIWRLSASSPCHHAVAVADTPCEDQGVHQEPAVDTYSQLHKLHTLCDGSQLAATAQLREWAGEAQAYLGAMSLQEVAYIASCLQHHEYVWQQQQHPQPHPQPHLQQSLQRSTGACTSFSVDAGFLQQACAAACGASTTVFHDLHHLSNKNEQQSPQQQPQAQQQLLQSLQHLLELLQWASREVVQQRQQLQHQLQCTQQPQQQGVGPAALSLTDLQAHRDQLQQLVQAQQQAQQLLQHPLLLLALPHANCWQLNQLLVCSGQLGVAPAADWMGHWLAAARHAMADLVLPYQQWQDHDHQQQHYGAHAQQHLQDYRAGAAAAYMQLVGLLSGLAAAHVKPPEAWAAAWQQAALAVLAAQPCFAALEGSSDSSSCSGGSRSFFSMLQQLLHAVSVMQLRLSADFWTAHEGLLQQQVLWFSPAELLRVLQLHQQSNLRPSRACIKYLAAKLEQHLQQQQEGGASPAVPGPSSSSSGVVLQLVMVTCGLSVWGVRLHLRSVAQLLLCLDAHKAQLPLNVMLQVLAILATRLARVYTASLAATNSSSSSSSSDSFTSSSSSSSDSAGSGASLSTISTDGEEPADMQSGVIGSTGVGADMGAPAASSAACALERLLMFAADQLTLSYMGQAGSVGSEAASPSNTHTGSAQAPADCGPLIKLLQVSAALARNGARGGSQIDTTDSITSYAAAAAAAVGGPRAPSSHGSFRDLVHKLHPLTAAVAVTCTPSQLVLLMGAWNQLGLSSAWRFGGFRRGYKRLGQQEVLQALSNAELAAAVEATARLPPTQSVVHALAAEVTRRQAGTVTQQQHDKGAEGQGQASAAAAVAPQPLSPAQLVAVVCAVPGLNAYWPPAVTLQLLQRVQGLVQHTLNPSQQWRLWNALQELQQQWKPSVMAAAAAAAAAAATDAPAPGHTGHSPAGEGEGAGGIHPAVTYAAAAAAASFKATGAGAASSGRQAAAMDLPTNSSTDTATSSSSSHHQPHQLLDELQDDVAAALARVQPDPDALPVEAAPPKVPRPLHASELEAGGPATESAAADMRPLLDAEGQRTQQQVLAAFAKAQKSLLSPHCSGAALVKVLEGLLLLLSVPRYAKAAKKNETVRRAVLRALEAAAWPDLLAQALDIQALLLLTAASRGLGSPPDSPYSQLLQQETSRVLADAPLTTLAAALGRIAALRLPRFSLNFTALRFWVGRLAQAARQSPEDALAVLVPLTQLGFKPAGGAAALVLQPLLDAAAAAGGMYSSNGVAGGEFSSVDINSSSTSSTACLRPAGVLTLTRVLADMGLNPDAANAQQLLKAHVGLMKHYSVGQLLQLSRCVMRLELLTTTVRKPSAAAMAQGRSDDASSSGGISSETEARQAGCWLAPAAGAWVEAWLKQLVKRGTAQMDTAQVVELQLLLCDLDFIPWHLSAAHSAHINASLQQLQARLAAVPADWQSPLAAAVQASYHSTQELRRLVAARARRMAHQQGSSNAAGGAAAAAAAATPPATLSSVRAAIASAMQPGDGAPVEAANTGALTETDSSSIAGATGVSRRFVSRKAAAAAAAGAGAAAGASPGLAQSGAGASGVSGFSYPPNPVGHQLQVLSHSKRVLLWAAIKHKAVRPLTAAWVESCCFNILLGGQHLTPAVATGLLLAVADVQHSSTTSSNERSTATTAAAEGGAPVSSEAALRDRALANLTGELVGRVVAALQVLRGALFVQTFGALSSARVSAVIATQAHSRSAGQPLHVLAPRQQQLLLAAVARVLPVLQPPQLPLLVSSMARLRLQPDALWLSTALEALAVKAAAAAAAGQPAQQLLLLAAAKQLLVCGGVLLLPTASASARPDVVVATDHQGKALQVSQAGPARTPSAATAAMLPVASALRALAAGAAQVLSSMFRRSQHQQPLQQAGPAATPEPPRALAAAAAVAAAFGDAQRVSDASSVALLLSSLATQLQLAQAATTPAGQQAATAAATTALGPAAVISRSLVDQGDGWAARDVPQQQPQEQPQQLLAAAVLLNAGSQVPLAADSAGGAAGVSAVRVARRSTQGQAWQGSAWHSMHRPERERQHARQQQQQRMLLGQLLQLQFLKASEQLVQAVWQGGYQQQQQPEPVSPAAGADLAAGAAVYATQVLLDPTGQLMQPRPAGQQEQQEEAQQVEADGVGPLRPHRLVAQGLQVQFDGLLRKAFMVAAAAAAGDRQHREQQRQQQQQQGSSGPVAERQGEPWWLPGSRDVSRLMQSAADEGGATSRRAGNGGRVAGDVSCSNSSSGCGGVVDDAAASEVVGGGLGGSVAGGEPVLVLPVMSRALDAQFARLMREVLHSSLAAGGANRGGG